MINAEVGFTSDVIKQSNRFIGRGDLVRSSVKSLNSPLSLMAIYGKRGVGKSSLLRQVQQMALGDYTLAKNAGFGHEIPKRPRRYLTVYYTCDSMISNAHDLLTRLCNDQDPEDGLLRLVPNDGKELIEFSRSNEMSGGLDLKLANWGTKGITESKYARVVEGDIVQTFRNFVNSIVTHQVSRMKYDGILIMLDEFDVIQNKEGLGSLIKSMSSQYVKFAICGIGDDLHDLVEDHASVERLLEEGSIYVKPMSLPESKQIVYTAEDLFEGTVTFDEDVVGDIAIKSQGYPYVTQLLGKECVTQLNIDNSTRVSTEIYGKVQETIKTGRAFPTLERQYQRAIGDSKDRQLLLHILAEQPQENLSFNDEVGRVILKDARAMAQQLEIDWVDQLLPRLLDERFGPVLRRVPERQGIYEFVNPVFRIYVSLRNF